MPPQGPSLPAALDRVLEEGRARRVAGGWLLRCPAHDDRSPSLKVDRTDEGKVLLHCHAGCEMPAILAGWQVTLAELEGREAAPHVNGHPHMNGKRIFEQPPPALTVAVLAREKGLPLDLVAALGWRNGPRGVEIPYPVREGHPAARLRLRHTLTGEKRLSWASGDAPIVAYEPDLGRGASASGTLVICEGETDTAALLAMGQGALGVPGASCAKTIESHHLGGVRRVYVMLDCGPEGEPDAGAGTFRAGVAARLRELRFAGRVVFVGLGSRAKDPCALLQKHGEAARALLLQALEDADPPPKGPKWRSLQEGVLGALRPAGPRLTTGLGTLDQALRGGIPRGRVVVLAGAPGAAKTSFAASLMDRWVCGGAVVVYLAADEPAEGIYTRLGQLANFDRDRLEQDDAEGERERTEYAAHCEGSLGVVLDPDDERDESTLEGAERVLWAVAADRKDLVRVLIVDSLQTVRCDEAELCETMRQKIDAKVAVCKRISRRGAVVVAISEMNRGGYRTGDRNVDASALASSKESGGIEYGAALLLGLRSVKGETGQVDIEVAKNRLGGSKPELRVLQDFKRCSFTEIAMPDREAEADDAREAAALKRDERVQHRLLQVIANGSYTSASAVSRRAKGRHEVNMCTLRMLLDEGAIVKVNGVLRLARPGQSNEQCGGDQ